MLLSILTALVLPQLLAASKKKTASEAPPPQLAAASELLDAEEAQRAVVMLSGYLEDHPKSAEALFLRSTGHLMLGDVEAGKADLRRSLELDPTRRQGWLNLGAVAISENQLDDALKAFEQAEELDPGAVENNLNIGAVLLLSGKLGPASERFSAYLASQGTADAGGAEAYYLVATNYAMAGYAALAVEHLREAIDREERARLRARTDANFSTVGSNPQFQELLTSDRWQPSAGAYTASKEFSVPYRARNGRLLSAVLDTLQLSGFLFDPRVEVTEHWALIWGELRIKVTEGTASRGKVEVSAPADQLTPKEWRERTESLFRGVEERLILSDPGPGAPGQD